MPYTPPTIGLTGLTLPSYADILNWLTGQFLAIYGAASYLGADSADFQDIAVRALQAYDTAQALQAVYLSMNPETSVGTSLDLCGRLIGTARKSASYSSVILTLSGAAGTVINNGFAKDVNGNSWKLPSPVTIGSGGTIAVTATASTLGNITANANDITTIATPTAGWTGVVNLAAAIPGAAVEPDSSYRARLLVAQTKPSMSLLPGTAAAIAAVSGVTRSQVYENPTNATDSNGLPPHSITCVVEGGAAEDVAQAIYDNSGVGCDRNGNTTVTITDPANPGITMPISFDVLAYVPVFVALNVHSLAGYTTATTAAIQAAVAAYLNSLGIGEGVVYSELFGAALNARPNPDQPLFSVRAIAFGGAAAQTTATTTASSPTITVASATGIATGQVVVGANIPAGTTVSAVSGTTITLSANATANATGIAVSFFPTGTSDLAVAFNKAASGSTTFVQITLV